MQQAWHIFLKDTRYLYREIAALFALAVIFAWMSHSSAIARTGDTAEALEVLYAVAIAYIIARLIHAESIPGENQFWITRPYRWTSLLTAKIIFLAGIIHLPVLIMQALLLLADGFSLGTIAPGLLWTQVFLLLGISLPCFALAAMTTGIVSFIGTILVLIAVGFVIVESRFQSLFLMFAPESLDWLRYSIPFVAGALAVPPVLYLQYRNRWTRLSELYAAGVALCGAVAFLFLQWSALFPVQEMFSKQSFPMEITRDASKAFVSRLYPNGLMNLSLPLRITGVPVGVRPQYEMFDLRWQRADGRALDLSRSRTGLGLHRNDKDPNAVTLSGTFYAGRPFGDGGANQPVSLRATIYLTLFGNKRDKTIAFQASALDAVDGLRCRDDYYDEIVCRAPFRWPGTLVSVKHPWGNRSPFTSLISYSPFPAYLQLNPIAERSGGPHWTKDRAAPREVTIESEEPLAYLRRDVEVTNFSIGAP